MLTIATLLLTKHHNRSDVGERPFWRDLGGVYAEKFWRGMDRAVRRPHRRVMLTDSPELCPAGVLPVDITGMLAHSGGWWAKLAVFAPLVTGEAPGPVFYSDLDNVPGDDIEPMLALADRLDPSMPCWMLDDVVYPGMANGSTLLFDPALCSTLWGIYASNPIGAQQQFSTWPHASDQAFLAHWLRQFKTPPLYLQAALPPGFVLNSRAELEAGAPYDRCQWVYGSWDPKPHESAHPYYQRYWV